MQRSVANPPTDSLALQRETPVAHMIPGGYPRRQYFIWITFRSSGGSGVEVDGLGGSCSRAGARVGVSKTLPTTAKPSTASSAPPSRLTQQNNLQPNPKMITYRKPLANP